MKRAQSEILKLRKKKKDKAFLEKLLFVDMLNEAKRTGNFKNYTLKVKSIMSKHCSAGSTLSNSEAQ